MPALAFVSQRTKEVEKQNSVFFAEYADLERAKEHNQVRLVRERKRFEIFDYPVGLASETFVVQNGLDHVRCTPIV